jgi:hypothetical protein
VIEKFKVQGKTGYHPIYTGNFLNSIFMLKRYGSVFRIYDIPNLGFSQQIGIDGKKHIVGCSALYGKRF